MRAVWLVVLAACSVPDKFLVDGGAGIDVPIDGPMLNHGDYVWIRSMSSIAMYGVAEGPAGIVVVGDLSVPGNLGGMQLDPVGGVDMVIAGFNAADASHIYSVRHGDLAQEFPFMDIVDSNGAPIVYGLTGMSPYDLGQGTTVSSGLADGYIGRYGSAAPAWVQRINGAGDDKILASAHGVGATVYAGGYFEQSPTFNGATLTSLGGRDIILARLNTFTGMVELTKQYATAGREEISGLASATNGVIVAGMFDSTLSFGGTAPTLMSGGGLDAYIAQVDANGAGLWAVSFGGTGDDRDPRVTTDAAGDLYVSGTFQNTVMFGTFPLVSAGGFDVFVIKLRGSDRQVMWAKQFGGTGDDGIRGIVADAKGNVIVTGWAVGAIDGGTTLGGADAVITSYAASDGTVQWRKVISTAGDDRAWACTLGSTGDIYATIHLGGPIDLGHDVIGPANPASVLARIMP